MCKHDPWHKSCEYQEDLGAHFGYPECCVAEFVLPGGSAQKYRGQSFNFKLRGTGFVPCKACNTAKTEDELVAEIIANRKCDEPFPFEDSTYIH